MIRSTLIAIAVVFAAFSANAQVGTVSMKDTTQLAAPLISNADAAQLVKDADSITFYRLISIATRPLLSEKQQVARNATKLGFTNGVTDKAAEEISATAAKAEAETRATTIASGYGSNY